MSYPVATPAAPAAPPASPLPHFPPPRPHPSSLPHLRTDLALLASLIARSAAQHRAQLFLRNAREVARLGRLVCAHAERALGEREGGGGAGGVGGAGRAGGAGGAGGAGPSTLPTPPSPPDTARLSALVDKLISALLRAAQATTLQIQLRHFLPLQLVLLAIYARTHAVARGLAAWAAPAPAPPAARAGASRAPVPAALGAPGGIVRLDVPDAELGERVDRAAYASARPAAPSFAQRAERAASPLPERGPAALPRSASPAPPALLADRPSDRLPGAQTAGRDPTVADASSAGLPAARQREPASPDRISEPAHAPAASASPLGAPDPHAPAKPKRRPEAGVGEASASAGAGAGGKKKKKRKDAMDDIFGF